MLTVNPVQAKELLVDCLKAKLVPMLTGSPGIGKSAIVKEIAAEYGLKVIDVRLSQSDPTDMNGFPHVDPETGKGTYLPMDIFPIESDPLPDGHNGWLLFLDEFNSASNAVQAAAYKVTLDRQIGKHSLHEKCVVMCAGNKRTDGAIVNRLSTAMQSRLVHLSLDVSFDNFIDYATEANLDHRITDYIKFKPESLYRFSPDHNDETYPCPRTWEFIHRLINKWDSIDIKKLPLLAGTIGEGAAREFLTFTRIYKSLPKMADIIRNPEGVEIAKDPSVLYALTGAVSNHFNKDNADALTKFVMRLPPEFGVVTFKDIRKRKPALTELPCVRQWIATNAAKFL